MDVATLGAVGTIAVGLAAATAAWIGHRGSHQGVVMTGYGGLLDRLQAERLGLEAKLAAAETALTAAYSDKAQLQAEIEQLEAQIADRDRQIAALGGPTP
ncbi:hypothetical protein J7I98_23480 [Streptomyces sp. ISL-98]|uniref:hypothetical protein n=1 Tax=Streptomyces sp. ISL-98 TaxID=2819192 RepID=UPI001BE9A279|nr:hypothetical protein [Streptomyces sp. ISL-98]MBT2508793.1 hypothetical protein [Streptomyces sp. ISL-98]